MQASLLSSAELMDKPLYAVAAQQVFYRRLACSWLARKRRFLPVEAGPGVLESEVVRLRGARAGVVCQLRR